MTSISRELLAVDVGAGTQDILVYDSAKAIENCYQLILPSQTTVLARRIERATLEGHDVCLTGALMGGGPFVSSAKKHIKAGLQVFATPQAAKSIRDDLDEVRALGVQIVDRQPPNTVALRTGDLDLRALEKALAFFEVDIPARLAVAVQDHGETFTESQRRFRFRHWREFIEESGRLIQLAYLEIPPYLTRMRAVQEMWPGAMLMDTGPAAIWGALEDDFAVEHRAEGLVVVNVGNQHTIAFLVKGNMVFGVFEHHTVILNQQTFADYMRRFQQGQLSDDEVYADNGHGCYIRPDYPPGAPFREIVVTGPNRRLANGTGWHTASPHGDMMLTGPFGLVAAARELGLVE